MHIFGQHIHQKRNHRRRPYLVRARFTHRIALIERIQRRWYKGLELSLTASLASDTTHTASPTLLLSTFQPLYYM